jgi:hypothetical protein
MTATHPTAQEAETAVGGARVTPPMTRPDVQTVTQDGWVLPAVTPVCLASQTKTTRSVCVIPPVITAQAATLNALSMDPAMTMVRIMLKVSNTISTTLVEVSQCSRY